ncbi:MAG: heavy-metal-associated domain-containing protein [Bacteroidetes bacterium]|nr:heavy-metal-associated domain-containing protein [Bacteroidota bacterium]
MKKLQLVFILLVGFAVASTAQVVKKGGIIIATIKTPTVQCEQCKNRIESYLSREEGVQKVVVDYKHKITKVTFVADRTTLENVKTAIANVGYDADDVTADPEAYKKLPTCCKKPEDGGGPEKKN